MNRVFEASGEVRGVDLLAAFVAIWRESTSGTLRFTRGATSAGFDLAEGNLVAVHSSEPRFETAAILTRAGKLEAAALERLSVPPGTDAALAALSAGLLTKREWKWGEKIRAIEILADLLSWPDGQYVFDTSARPERGEFVLTIPRLLLELFLRSRDRNLIEHQLGPTDVPLVRSKTFDEEFATFGLTADAESVVRLIDGQATASEISEKAPAEEFAVLKLLAALKTLGLLATEPVVQAAPSVSSAKPETAAGPLPSPLDSWSPAGPPPVLPAETPQEEKQSALAQSPLEGSESVFPGGEDRGVPWDSREPAPFPVPDEPAQVEPGGEPGLPPWEESEVDAQGEPTTGQPLDRPLEDAAGVAPTAPKPGRRWGLLLGVGLLLVIAAIAATVLLRSRSTSSPVATIGQRLPTAPAATALPTAAFTPAPAPTAAPTSAPTSLPTRGRAPTAPVPSAAASTKSVRPSVAGEGRAGWLERARRESRKLQSDKRTRYAVQLELVCEVDSLVEAWKHDRPAGSMWLLTTSHGGRECFRVLWGHYTSIEEARRAKAGIPSYFVTASNRPAVASVR